MNDIPERRIDAPDGFYGVENPHGNWKIECGDCGARDDYHGYRNDIPNFECDCKNETWLKESWNDKECHQDCYDEGLIK